MNVRIRRSFGGVMAFLAGFAVAGPLLAQPRTAGEWAWKPILMHEGVRFEYLFYPAADNFNNGVVVKLTNTNDHPVAYRFTIIFRAEGATHEEYVEGRLAAREIRTGDAAGLFWVPFRDGRSIGEVGLRGFRVTPLPEGAGGRTPFEIRNPESVH
ncbi:MAG: hypothetical protein KatS3mg043_0940 [Rhodothermaceae bacterium]|nr:MAG: hypothetical protein KatS3mg043_0940 [Rhodothermaceae bacterium]